MFSSEDLIKTIQKNDSDELTIMADAFIDAKNKGSKNLNFNFFNDEVRLALDNGNQYCDVRPLYAAVETGDLELVIILLKVREHFDINASSQSGSIQFNGEEEYDLEELEETALGLAARLGLSDIALLLKAQGAMIDRESRYQKEYKTPLIAALHAKKYQTALELVRAGSALKYNKESRCRHYPLVELVKSIGPEDNLKEFIALLLTYETAKPSILPALVAAAERNDLAITEMLLPHVSIEKLSTLFTTKSWCFFSMPKEAAETMAILKYTHAAAKKWGELQIQFQDSDLSNREELNHLTEELIKLLEFSYHPIIKNKLHSIIGKFLFENDSSETLELTKLAMQFLLTLHDEKSNELQEKIMLKLEQKTGIIFEGEKEIKMEERYERYLEHDTKEEVDEFEEGYIPTSPRSALAESIPLPAPSTPWLSTNTSPLSFLWRSKDTGNVGETAQWKMKPPEQQTIRPMTEPPRRK